MTNTITGAFLATVKSHGDVPAFRWLENGEWKQITWAETAMRVGRVAGGLRELGVKPGDKVALLTGNRPEFHITDLAVLFCGATPVSLYSSSSDEQIAELTSRLNARLVVRDGDVIDGPPIALSDTALPGDLATIIFTSGTTSQPKGVMLTHANVTTLIESVSSLMNVDLAGKRVISYLPLAHIAERALSHYLPVFTAMTVTNCPDPTRLGEYLKQTRPHLFFGVPRVWEKLQAGAERELGRMGAIVKSGSVARRLASPLIRRIREQLGFDQLIFAASGAAPLSVDTANWFNAIGVPFSELYGMSETTGPITWTPAGNRVGSVGKPIPGVEVRLLPDGEIVCKGQTIFPGYLDDVDATNAALHDGWLCTGDIGEIDADGFVKIVDRKKDLIITAGGKNISPAALEAKLESHSDIAHACVIGDRRSFISAVIAVDGAVNADVEKRITHHVATVNASVSQAERIKQYRIVNDSWTPGSDVLTHTLKVRRRGVELRYLQLIESIYSRKAA